MNTILRKLIILCVIVSLFSCETEDTTNNSDNILNSRVLTKNELVTLGNDHNKYLNNYYKKVKENLNDDNLMFRTSNSKDLLIDEFMNSKDFEWNETDSRSGLTHVVDETIDMQSSNFSPENFINNLDETGRDFVNRIDNYLINNNNISILNSQIENITNEINNSNLSILDKNGILGYAYILQSSAKLWAPISIGGEGLYDEINGGTSNKLSARRWSWSRAARGDAAGSMVFFLGIGLTIVAPPAGLAILSAWAWSAAAGSVIAGSGII